MVSVDEIGKLGKLMRIDIDDHKVHLERVKKMIDYFTILDKADIESEELVVNEIDVEQLREDNYAKNDDSLISKLKNYKDSYIKAPKLS